MKSSLFYRPGGKAKNHGKMGPDATRGVRLPHGERIRGAGYGDAGAGRGRCYFESNNGS